MRLNQAAAEDAALEGVSLNQYAVYRLTRSAPVPNAETLQAIYDAEHGIGLSKTYTDVDEMMKDILEGDD